MNQATPLPFQRCWGKHVADHMNTVSSPVAPTSSRDDDFVNLDDAYTRHGEESYTPAAVPNAILLL